MTKRPQTAKPGCDFRPRGVMTTYTGVTREQADEAMRRAEGGFYVVVAAANELASVAVFDAMERLRREGFHGCAEGARWARQCQRQVREYETAMRLKLREASRRDGAATPDGRDKYTLWLDLTDHVDEEMKPHMDRLYYAVKMLMDRNRAPQSETLARMWTARILLQVAVAQFEGLFDRLREAYRGLSLRPLFASGSMQGPLKCWAKATDAIAHRLCPKDGRDIELGLEANVANGVRAIINKLDDYNLYNRGAEYSIRLNRGIVGDELAGEYGVE